MSGGLSSFERRRHRPTLLMPENQDQFRSQVLYCIFDAAQNGVIHDIAGHTDHEQITQTLVKQQLRGGRENRRSPGSQQTDVALPAIPSAAQMIDPDGVPRGAYTADFPPAVSLTPRQKLKRVLSPDPRPGFRRKQAVSSRKNSLQCLLRMACVASSDAQVSRIGSTFVTHVVRASQCVPLRTSRF